MERTPTPPQLDDPYLASDEIHTVIPLFVKAVLIAGQIILIYSVYVRVYAGKGCFSFADILVCRDVHASSLK